MLDYCGVAEHDEDCLCDVKDIGPVAINFTPLDVAFGRMACDITDTAAPWTAPQLADLLECMGELIEVAYGSLPEWATADSLDDWRGQVVDALNQVHDHESSGTGGKGAAPLRRAGRPLSFIIAATGLYGNGLATYLGVPADSLQSWVRLMTGVEPLDNRTWPSYNGDEAYVRWVQRARELREKGVAPSAIPYILKWEGAPREIKESTVDNWLRPDRKRSGTREQRNEQQRKWRAKNKDKTVEYERSKRDRDRGKYNAQRRAYKQRVRDSARAAEAQVPA